MKCDVIGCKHEARWTAVKLFGDRGRLEVCNEHKPDAGKRPVSLRHLPFFYHIEPIGERKQCKG